MRWPLVVTILVIVALGAGAVVLLPDLLGGKYACDNLQAERTSATPTLTLEKERTQKDDAALADLLDRAAAGGRASMTTNADSQAAADYLTARGWSNDGVVSWEEQALQLHLSAC